MSWPRALLQAWLIPGCIIGWLCFQDDLTIQRQVVDLPGLAGLPGTTSAVSYLGVALWHWAAAACWFTSLLLVGGPRRGLQRAATLSLLLAIDDGFMLHEEVLPQLLHLSASVVQPGIYCVYGLLLIGALKRFPELWRRPESRLFIAALLCLGASIGIDMAKDSGWFGARSRMILDPAYAMWVEESLKLLGISAWTSFWWRWCAWLSRSGSWSDPASQGLES